MKPNTVFRALATVSILLFLAKPALAETLVVGQNAPTLIDTIALAQAGDIVEVPEGLWRGPVRIEKTLVVRGSGTIDGGGVGQVVVLAAPNIELNGLTIQASGDDVGASDACIYTEPEAVHSVISNNTLRDCAFGIWIHQTDYAQILDNRVRGRADVRTTDRGNGIHLFDASYLLVRGNEVVDSRDGLYVSATMDSVIEDNRVSDQRFGIHYMYSYRNTIRGNTANRNLVGLALMESRELLVENNIAIENERTGLLFRDATLCTIRFNQLERNGQGMFLFSSTENVIDSNRLVANEVGMKVWAGSRRNAVENNAFIANAQQVFYVGAEDQIWGEDGSGNYWSDYVGWDQDGNGIGERPQRVDSFSANLIHRYPAAILLMRSPSIELLTHLEARTPVLRVPTIVDVSPLIAPR